MVVFPPVERKEGVEAVSGGPGWAGLGRGCRFQEGLRRLKLHGIKRQKVPKIQGLKKHQKNHSLACKKSSRF